MYAAIRQDDRMVVFRPLTTSVNINGAQPCISAIRIQLPGGVRQYKLETGFPDWPAPVVARHVPVQLIPVMEAAEMVANLIANFIVINTWLQCAIGAANAHGQRFCRAIEAVGFRESIA